MSEKLTQEEIDHLTQEFGSGAAFDISPISEKISVPKEVNNALKAAIERLYYARLNESFGVVRYCEREVKMRAHALWLAKRGLTRYEFCQIMKHEMEKRGLKYCPQNPPGYKLVKINGPFVWDAYV